MKYLLDTDTCISNLRSRESRAAQRLSSMAVDEVTLCSVVRAELFYGVRRSRRPDVEEAKLRAFLSVFRSIPFDDEAAEVYGRLRARLAMQGVPIGPNDLMIAAIAVVHNLTLVTHNTREFSRIQGLNIEDWEAPAI